jgi:hypothetical protein
VVVVVAIVVVVVVVLLVVVVASCAAGLHAETIRTNVTVRATRRIVSASKKNQCRPQAAGSR